MNPTTLEQLDKHRTLMDKEKDTGNNYQLENYRKTITKLEHTIKLLKDDKIYLQKLIDRPTLSMKIMARIDILLSHVGLKRIRRNK